MTAQKARPKNWYYGVLQIAKKQLNMDEQAYRSMLVDFGASEKSGKVSATTMTVPQLEQALSHLQSCGFKVRSKKTPSSFKHGQINKCKQIWVALHKAGVMRQPYSEASLTKFAFNMTRVNNINWATPTGLAKTIEALKNMAQRERVEIG